MGCRILALYLPQFHRIKENDLWWGEGFTEWNSVRKAISVSAHSKQPRVPLDGYYDLLYTETLQRQAKDAKDFGLDGFVFYTYYSNGEKLLEKPAELLLHNMDIDMHYCFSWANHDWKRTWYSCNYEMLREQKYPQNDKQIEEQFAYYESFFLDRRYICYNNMPVFFIWDAGSIPDFQRIKDIWNAKAKQLGFCGIYFVQTLGETGTGKNEMYDAYMNFEPFYTILKNKSLSYRFQTTMKKLGLRKKPLYYRYCNLCRKMISSNESDANHLLGVVGEFDDTPRHGVRGEMITGFTIDRFEKLICSQYKKSIRYGKPFIVINAWNEWSEGAFLEADEIYGYKKLNAIRKCKERFADYQKPYGESSNGKADKA